MHDKFHPMTSHTNAQLLQRTRGGLARVSCCMIHIAKQGWWANNLFMGFEPSPPRGAFLCRLLRGVPPLPSKKFKETHIRPSGRSELSTHQWKSWSVRKPVQMGWKGKYFSAFSIFLKVIFLNIRLSFNSVRWAGCNSQTSFLSVPNSCRTSSSESSPKEKKNPSSLNAPS